MSDTPPRAPAPPRLGDLALDGAAILGAGLIVVGVALIYRPAAFIVAGAFLLAAAWLLARRGG